MTLPTRQQLPPAPLRTTKCSQRTLTQLVPQPKSQSPRPFTGSHIISLSFSVPSCLELVVYGWVFVLGSSRAYQAGLPITAPNNWYIQIHFLVERVAYSNKYNFYSSPKQVLNENLILVFQ